MGSDSASIQSGAFLGSGRRRNDGKTAHDQTRTAFLDQAGRVVAAAPHWAEVSSCLQAPDIAQAIDRVLNSGAVRFDIQVSAGTFGTAAPLLCVVEKMFGPDSSPAGARIALSPGKYGHGDFLAEISHEMRTPLNAVIGFSEMIQEQVWGSVGDSRYLEYAADIHISAKLLLDLIDQLLEMAKADSGELELQDAELDLPALLEAIEHMVGPQAKKAGLTIKADVPHTMPPLRGDLRMIRRIVLNLTSNALKFTPPGGNVVLKCGTAEDGGIFIAAEDDGIGIAPGQMEQVMMPFVQIDSDQARKADCGIGLGLAISQKFARLHNADLSLSARPGGGTIAAITFPAYRGLSKT